MTISIFKQIMYYVENTPYEIECIYDNGIFLGYIIRLENFEFQIALPYTHPNPHIGLKPLKKRFLKTLINDFKTGKPLPFPLNPE